MYNLLRVYCAWNKPEYGSKEGEEGEYGDERVVHW
jgi:hypothetical protein